MAHNARRPAKDYSSVPQSPRGHMYSQPRPLQPTKRSASGVAVQQGRGTIAQGVATGAIGAGYGPYAYNPQQTRDVHTASKFSAPSDSHSSSSGANNHNPPNRAKQLAVGGTSTVPQYLWDRDPDLDDALHNPDPIRDAKLDRSFTLFSARGWMNVSALVILVAGLITLFAGYPIIAHYTHRPAVTTGYNIGGINGSGQIPDLPGLPSLVDKDTPDNVKTRTGFDGQKYNLVFSDEFNRDGRTFYPGEDPFWEAVDLHYWPTGDLEWYDPSAAITKDGSLQITLSMENIHDLNWKSAMLTTWNKLCFTTGYIEVKVSFPGSANTPGYWPGAWTMANLARAGYGATTDGTWPYSYDSCDVGTFPNQTDKNGNPSAASGLSYQPGQRVSACTCPGNDHPGPSVSTGRGAPEIDILEHQINLGGDQWTGQVSQSYQIAPFNLDYDFDEDSDVTTVYNDSITSINSYKGAVYQQAVSAVTDVDRSFYGGEAFGVYGFEWWSNPDDRSEGYIEWVSDGQPAWKITAGSVGADSQVDISDRLISEEPHYVILNLGIAYSFQHQDYAAMVFPTTMFIDYVRIYQRAGLDNALTCDPPNRPTNDYINNHINAYSNPNLTTWDQAGYAYPRNSQYDGC